MKIILLENIEKVGFKDEVVNVKPGFARNYLIPSQKAVLATESAVKVLNEKLKQQQRKEEELLKEINQQAELLPTLNVKIQAKTGEDGKKLFGSITTIDFVKTLSALGHEIDRKFVKFNTIKEIGSYEAEVRLHRSVKVSIPFEVVVEK